MPVQGLLHAEPAKAGHSLQRWRPQHHMKAAGQMARAEASFTHAGKPAGLQRRGELATRPCFGDSVSVPDAQA